jgi:hypothetical protein
MTFQGTDRDVGDDGVHLLRSTQVQPEDNYVVIVVNPTRDGNLAVQCTDAFPLSKTSLYTTVWPRNGVTYKGKTAGDPESIFQAHVSSTRPEL